MKDDNLTKEEHVHELTELRSQNAALKKSMTGSISAELAAEEASRYAESIVETVREPLLVLDADLKIISANRNFYRTFKVTPGETIGSFIYDLGNKQWDIPKLREMLEETLPKKESFNDFEVTHNFLDIGHKIMLLNARRIYRKDIDAKMILLAIDDITERKRRENLLTESEERYRRLFETASDGIVLLEKREGKITHANPATEKLLGYTKKDSIGNSLQDIGISLDEGDFQTTMQNLNTSGILNYDDVTIKTKSGQHIYTDIYLVDRATLVQCNIRDITERKLIEEKAQRTQSRLRILVDILQHPSDTIQDFLDYALDKSIQLTKSKIGYISHYNEDRKEFVLNTWSKEVMAECTVSNKPTCYELDKTGIWGEAVRQRKPIIINDFQAANPLKKGYPEGHVQLLKLITVPIFKDGIIIGVVGLANKENDYDETDILQASLLMEAVWNVTEQKQAEAGLKETLEQYRSLAANVDSMYLVNRDGTYLFMNEGHLKRFGLALEEVVGKRYSEFHSDEEARQFVKDVGEIYKTGTPSTKEHRSERDGKFFLRTFTPIIGQNVDGKISKVAIISKDISDIKLAERKLQDTLDSLRKAINTTIQVMVSAVETRDPYTAGHQLRSSDLARAIATEMGLSPEKIDGICLAGSIHDIGKLSIPAEILSKPTKLSELEFALIKEHATKGYEILKDVESPWPLAEIVRQHHERMDGSGYPRNLKGEEICLEARILSVSDVVEAMASHRPYRPGLGINAALEEIEKNSGILYDKTVADACLRLFREKSYKLEGT